MAIQKNQHYVPQFYQRRFSPDGKTIGSYIIEQERKIDIAPIKHQASQDYFYTKETEQKNNVEDSLGKLEAMTQKVMEMVDADPRKALDKIMIVYCMSSPFFDNATTHEYDQICEWLLSV